MQETEEMHIYSLGREDPVEEEMETHRGATVYRVTKSWTWLSDWAL